MSIWFSYERGHGGMMFKPMSVFDEIAHVPGKDGMFGK